MIYNNFKSGKSGRSIWTKSRMCTSCSCIEVLATSEKIYVKDSKLDGDPFQQYIALESHVWESLLATIKSVPLVQILPTQVSGEQPLFSLEGLAILPTSANEVVFDDRSGVTLTYTAAEWQAFVEGVISGDFDNLRVLALA